MVSATDVAKLQDTVQLIQSEKERVKEYFNALPPDALEQSSACEMWNVGDTIAHLVWFAESYGSMLERGLGGDVSAPTGFPTAPGTLSGLAIEKFYGHAAIARLWSLGQDLLPTFNQRYDHLNAVLKGIGPEDWDKPCYQTSMIRPVRWFLPVTVSELSLHEWDIRSALEPAPNFSADSLPTLIEYIPSRRWPWTIPFRSGPASSAPVSYRFDLTGVAGSSRDVIVEGDQPRLEHPGDRPADLSLSGHTGAFVLLMYGRLTLGSAIASGRFTAEGNLDLVADFDRWLAGH